MKANYEKITQETEWTKVTLNSGFTHGALGCTHTSNFINGKEVMSYGIA